VLGPRDPGSPFFARLGLLLAIGLVAVVALVQQLGGSVMQKGAPKPASIQPPPMQVEVMAKVYAKVRAAMYDPAHPEQAETLGAAGVSAVDQQAETPEDRLRAALLAGELQSTEEALKRLDEIEPTFPADSPLTEDAKTIRALYAGDTPEAPNRAQLIVNHGWIGKLAATHGKPDTDPERAKLLAGGMQLVILAALVGAAVLFGLLAGTVLLIVGVVRASNGTLRMRFVPPMPGGSLGIEMVIVFIIGFLVLKGISAAVESSSGGKVAIWTALILQWGLCSVLLWPRVRGVPVRQGLALLGWNRGQGVLREIGCGLIGYLACLPIMACGVLTSFTLLAIWALIQKAMGHKAPPPPNNTILDLAGGKAGPLILLMLYVLASVWAPLMEETIFRGALYRHLRSKWHWFPAAFLTALCFGFMHGYPILLLGPVISLGFGFAMLREWRGSLLASMTAHCIHNAMVLALVIFAMKIMAD
jgi:membrane protease YdiL (CAAX protease family)